MRKCIVIIDGEQREAYFHTWDHRAYVVDASPLRGGHPGGQVSSTYAICELADGSIIEVDPIKLKFTDPPILQGQGGSGHG